MPTNNKISGITLNKDTEKGVCIAIPVLGMANCGDVTIIAKEKLEGYIKVQRALLELEMVKLP